MERRFLAQKIELHYTVNLGPLCYILFMYIFNAVFVPHYRFCCVTARVSVLKYWKNVHQDRNTFNVTQAEMTGYYVYNYIYNTGLKFLTNFVKQIFSIMQRNMLNSLYTISLYELHCIVSFVKLNKPFSFVLMFI